MYEERRLIRHDLIHIMAGEDDSSAERQPHVSREAVAS